jgi:hypothetical protein
MYRLGEELTALLYGRGAGGFRGRNAAVLAKQDRSGAQVRDLLEDVQLTRAKARYGLGESLQPAQRRRNGALARASVENWSRMNIRKSSLRC